MSAAAVLSVEENTAVLRLLVKVAAAAGVDSADPDLALVRAQVGQFETGAHTDGFWHTLKELKNKGCTCAPDIRLHPEVEGEFLVEHQDHCALPRTIEWEKEQAAARARAMGQYQDAKARWLMEPVPGYAANAKRSS